VLQSRQRLGEFEIVRLLGKGGMGEVYEAQQDRPRRRVALKVLAPWLAENEEALARFWREAEVPAQLNHPGIVRIISTGQTEGTAYYTMNLVQGMSLADMIRWSRDVAPPTVCQRVRAEDTPSPGASPTPAGRPAEDNPGAFTVQQKPPLFRAYQEERYRTVARLGLMVAQTLAYAHSRGCVHRDLKPSNIMVDQRDHAYVMDFGLTRALEPDGLQSQPGMISGTPWYMSPEQAKGEVVDHRSDIYSLGVTLYELATQGSGPYDAHRSQREAVLTQVRNGQLLPLRSLAPDIPPALEAIILKAMSFRATRRHADAGQLARDLERFLEQPLSPPPVPAGKPGRGWKAVGVGAGLALAVLVLAALLWTALGGRRAPSDGGDNAGDGALQKATWERNAGGRTDYPESLRNRPWRVPQALLNLDNEPVWNRRLTGTGRFQRKPMQLMLSSPPQDNQPTLIALDDDPARRWFELSLELNAPLAGPETNRFGVFFGWRKETSCAFVVEIDEHPCDGCPQGRARIGTLRVIEGRGADAGSVDFRWLPGEKGQLPLLRSGTWHRLAVHALDDQITVTVDDKRTSRFTMDWLLRSHQEFASSVDPRGALGIWAWRGHFCSFRSASVSALPSGEEGNER
jgi:serine/threonine protein kinase